jgi:hypothetical protein
MIQKAMIALMIEVARTFETSVYFNEIARRSIREGCHLHTRRHENLKSHQLPLVSSLLFCNENDNSRSPKKVTYALITISRLTRR